MLSVFTPVAEVEGSGKAHTQMPARPALAEFVTRPENAPACTMVALTPAVPAETELAVAWLGWLLYHCPA